MTDFSTEDEAASLAAIEKAERALERRYKKQLVVNPDLARSLVSFQANKTESGYRWCKYREGFSAALIRYVMRALDIRPSTYRRGKGKAKARLLDPFAGSGTSLFCASEIGLDSTGIELLPSSCEIIRSRVLATGCDTPKTIRALKRFAATEKWKSAGDVLPFSHLRITAGAFSKKTEQELGRYLFEVTRLRNNTVRSLLRFAALCILEEVSYTRKDGQYLRWDARSGRKGKFNKGRIADFSTAVVEKIDEIIADMREASKSENSTGEETAALYCAESGQIDLLEGSCLEELPKLKANSFSAIVTSPPYCNRYDYTRTYALELAMLGVDEVAIRELRQTMLTCTVENRVKEGLDRLSSHQRFQRAEAAFESQKSLSRICDYLTRCNESGKLNNTGIPRMVTNYFREMALVIHECARVLKPGAPFVMVNDNVRYQGVHVPVDLILSDFARSAGLDVERIWVLPRGKGNSSQQMGKHGRAEIRKCVYVWRKPA